MVNCSVEGDLDLQNRHRHAMPYFKSVTNMEPVWAASWQGMYQIRQITAGMCWVAVFDRMR